MDPGKKVAKDHKKSLEELHAAALCFGAVDSKVYTDSRRGILRKRGLNRLLSAARDYHSRTMALWFLSTL